VRLRRWSLFVVPVLIALVAASCGGGSDAAAKPKTTTTTAPPTTTTAPPPPVAPLTGLPDPSGASLNRPLLSVKIENTPEARPQTGIDAADVVYEQVAEGGITRFIVLFDSNIPETMGPIRSTRAMDADVIWPLGGVFAYSGGIPQSVALVQNSPANAVDETKAGNAMFRASCGQVPNPAQCRAPHNLFGRGPALVAMGGKPVPVPALFPYLAAGETFQGDPVANFTVDFIKGYQPTYTWDATSKTWLRSYGLFPFKAASGTQIAPTNVVVQLVGCCVPSPEAGSNVVVGSGSALIFSDGKVVHGSWSRPTKDQITQFLDANGQPVKLDPGKTWVELVPTPPFGIGAEIVAGPPPPPTTAAPTTLPPTTTKPKK
jgi:Protein of unknown function (DUF3048) N-terminal domain/Protein of unknown function (DUF3048) C-terminal domain